MSSWGLRDNNSWLDFEKEQTQPVCSSLTIFQFWCFMHTKKCHVLTIDFVIFHIRGSKSPNFVLENVLILSTMHIFWCKMEQGINCLMYLYIVEFYTMLLKCGLWNSKIENSLIRAALSAVVTTLERPGGCNDDFEEVCIIIVIGIYRKSRSLG